MPERHPSRKQGFTLIETIVVLVILGLALSIVAGFLPRRSATLELSGVVERVSGALRLARSRALTQDRPVLFVVAADGHGYRVDNTPVTLPPTSPVIAAQPQALVFAPDGSTSGGTLRVSIDGRQRVIRVNWLTGRISVADS